MVQKVQTILEDDLDGGPADETVTFSLDGVTYEIDLTSAHAKELRDAFAVYVGNARHPVVPRQPTPIRRQRAFSDGRSGGGDIRSPEIRTWARANGYQVNERGRLPKGVVEAYDMAH